MNYFGYLKKENLSTLSPDDKISLFLSKNLYTSSKVLNLPTNTPVNLLDPVNFKIVREPIKELLNDYYEYITSKYQEHIEHLLIDFFHSFNDLVFAMEDLEAKKIGRLHYLRIANSIQSPNLDIVRMYENATGIAKVKNASKLELYSIREDVLKIRAIQEYPKGLDQFLMGNSKHFNNELISEIPILEEIIQFKGDLKILLALNDEFLFEEFDFNYAPKIENNNSIKTKTNNTLPLSQIPDTSLPMPTEEEMDQYLLEYVFSKKD